MSISIFDIFKVGIGPSSSHTVGPMNAAKKFIDDTIDLEIFDQISFIKCDLYGSLALTGRGHGTDKAVLLGFLGYTPNSIDSDKIDSYISNIIASKQIILNSTSITQTQSIPFNMKSDLKFNGRANLPLHPNGMAIACFDQDKKELYRQIYYSIGGGFILTEDQFKIEKFSVTTNELKYPFNSAKELLEICSKHNLTIPQLMYQNEQEFQTIAETKSKVLSLWSVMNESIQRGYRNEGILPGGLKVKRRAPNKYRFLSSRPEKSLSDPLSILDWVNLYALAVNEENAAGGKIVTAPTNGAAGIIPAVLSYYTNFCNSSDDGVVDFFLTAGAIALLYKKNASLSGAEVGCQGEVGVACSMAAGALTQVMGGTPQQVENAAEIAMEHNLGLTCDPIGGLVQVPCIERNAMGAIKAINASRLALRGDGTHFVSLDKVIKTMFQTGKDMKKQYKETSRGGLAVNLPEC